MRSELRLAGLLLFAVLASESVWADSMAVPAVALREESAGKYVLEAQMAPVLVPGARPPMAPDRCSVSDASRVAKNGGVQLSFAIDCGDAPLRPDDVLVLPWSVDGIQMTAMWSDGQVKRALFGREQIGVVIRLDRILERDESLAELAVEHGLFGWRHALSESNHWIFAFALVLAVMGSARKAFGALGGWLAGHAVALVLSDVGVSGLPLAPSEALVAGAAALFVAAAVRGSVSMPAFATVAVLLGSFHGLAMAGDLNQSGLSSSRSVPALFLANSGIDLGNVLLVTAALVLFNVGRAFLERYRAYVSAFLGTASMFLLFATMTEGLIAAQASAGAGFMEMDALVRSEPVSAAPTIAVPPRQIDASGQLMSPFMSYLIVEPYQVRHEVLVDLKSAVEWITFDVDAREEIPVDRQSALTDELARLIAERSPIHIDGARARVASMIGEFVALGANGALARGTPVPEPLSTAIVGVTLVYETASIAESVSLDWGLFSAAGSAVPLTVTDPLAVEASELSPSASRYEWSNRLGDFELPKIEAITATRPEWPFASLGLAVLALVTLSLGRGRSLASFCLVAAYGFYPFVRVEATVPWIGEARIDREASTEVLERLLTNVYRCFDIHNEDAIYDRLALTVTGEQLLAVYLESRRALELENRGGARVRIDEVVVREVRSVKQVGNGGYAIDTVWTVGGSVNHFGHLHFRQNRYDATITIVPVEGTWKIRSMELLQETREL